MAAAAAATGTPSAVECEAHHQRLVEQLRHGVVARELRDRDPAEVGPARVRRRRLQNAAGQLLQVERHAVAPGHQPGAVGTQSRRRGSSAATRLRQASSGSGPRSMTSAAHAGAATSSAAGRHDQHAVEAAAGDRRDQGRGSRRRATAGPRRPARRGRRRGGPARTARRRLAISLSSLRASEVAERVAGVGARPTTGASSGTRVPASRPTLGEVPLQQCEALRSGHPSRHAGLPLGQRADRGESGAAARRRAGQLDPRRRRRP